MKTGGHGKEEDEEAVDSENGIAGEAELKRIVPARPDPLWYQHIVAGAVAGIISKTVTAPLDRIKIFAQVEAFHRNLTVRTAIKEIVKHGGIWALWKGNFIALLKVGPETATKFAMYDVLKKRIQDGDQSRVLSLRERFIAAAGAGVTSQIFVYPLDVVKTRTMLSGNKHSPITIAKIGYYQKGWMFFVRGLFASSAGSLIFTGLDLSIYETIKRKFIESNVLNTSGQKPHSGAAAPGIILLCGMISSSVAQIAAYPFSSLTSSLQAEDHPKRFSSTMIYKKVISNKLIYGPSAMYRGLTASLLKGVPSITCTYLVYETALALMGTSMGT